MEERTVEVPGIHCGHCVSAVQTELGDIEGVGEVTGDVATKLVTIRFAPPATWEAILALLDDVGYPPAPSL